MDVMTGSGTYVYCLVADKKRPRRPRRHGLPGLGVVRLLRVGPEAAGGGRVGAAALPLWAVVADAPLDKYGERAIHRGLTDLDWVSRAAVAHETIVESFITAAAVLPMKLFTIFKSDERVLEHMARERRQIGRLLERVKGHDEWGIRVAVDREAVLPAPRKHAAASGRTGAGYLQRKKAQRDASAEIVQRSGEVVAGLYDRLGRDATLAKRRPASELPAKGGPLLLDAAFLVPRSRATRFRAAAARQARNLMPQGYAITLSGPWPPYTFMQD
jgi:hypothetical protein